MVKYKNKNLKITLSLVVSTMSIIMTNCMDGQGSGSSSSSSQKALDVLLGSSVVKVTEHDSKINVLQDKVRELEEEVNDLRNQLDLQQSVRQLELLQLRDPLVTEQHASWTIVDLMRHIEDLSRQRVEDREYINQQVRDLSRQRGEDRGYLSQHIRENIRQIVNDLRKQLDLQQSVRQLEWLQLRDPLFTEQHASLTALTEDRGTIVDLMRHIEDLSRQRVEDREYINQQVRDLSRQRGEDGYLSQHIRENIRQLSIHSICFGLVPILSALGFYTYLIELLTQSIYWVR